MKRILVPCDFSHTARQAFGFALQIARRTNAELFVLKAMDFPFAYEGVYSAHFIYHNPDLLSELKQVAENAFEELKKEYGSYERLHFATMQGPVVQVIQSFIQNEEIDLVVMGTNGATGMREYLVGSNTEKVVRFSSVPVIAVRQAVTLGSIKHIVVPTDAGDIYPAFISALTDLQQLFNATLHLLLVSNEYRIMEGTELLKKLADYAYRAGLDNCTINLQQDETKEGGIVDFARATGGDMIAMATHGRQGLAHLFAGSLAEDVVNHVNCPVWTFSVRDQARQRSIKDRSAIVTQRKDR